MALPPGTKLGPYEIVALLGAGVLVFITRLERSDYLSGVEWETLLFFAGLFIMVGALVKTGVINDLARLATDATGGNALVTVMLILAVSAPLSGVIDNIPYVATMTPIAAGLAASMHGDTHQNALWWALAIGADFGVDVRMNQRLRDVRPDEGGFAIDFDDGTSLGAGAVLAAVGSSLDLAWLEGSGLTLDHGVVVDRDLQAAPNVAAPKKLTTEFVV